MLSLLQFGFGRTPERLFVRLDSDRRLADLLADQAIDRDLDLVVDGGWLTPFLQFPEFGRSPLLAFAVAKAGGGMPAPAVRLGPARVILCRAEVAVEFGEQRFVVCGHEASVSGQPRGRAGLL